MTEIIIMGLFAMSFNLLLGYSGLLSFGQAGFFGVGAYTAALLITSGTQSLWLIFAASLLFAALTALVIGYLCVRRDEIYFAMITLGFGMMLFTVAHNWIELTGGSDGLPLAIARALAGNPMVPLLDEPREGLAPVIVESLEKILGELKKEITVLLTEQNARLAFAISDRGYIIDKGRVRYKGETRELVRNQEVQGRYLAV